MKHFSQSYLKRMRTNFRSMPEMVNISESSRTIPNDDFFYSVKLDYFPVEDFFMVISFDGDTFKKEPFSMRNKYDWKNLAEYLNQEMDILNQLSVTTK